MIDEAARTQLIVELRGISRAFGSGATRVEALRGVDLDVVAGEYVAVRGASGCGKSTLLQVLGLLDRPDAGTYRLHDRLVSELPDRERTRLRNEEIGFVFQTFQLLADRSALENARLPLVYRRSPAGARDPRALLERVGLGARLRHRPGQLSGGEKQRVAIVRALVKNPRLILLDEPTGNLDTATGDSVLDLLDEIHRELGATLLLVTHDPRVAARAQRTLEMRDGNWQAT